MLFRCLCVFLLCMGAQSADYFSDPGTMNDFNGTFIIFDVSSHKGSGGNLKGAFNHLKNVEYSVKFVGEEGGLFVVRDDDNCDTLQADFHGLQVNALAAMGRDNSVTFSETGLLVMIIESTLESEALSQGLDDALERCDNCFKVFAVIGSKPQTCYLIGNIPLDHVADIVNSTTGNQCCDRVTTRRAVDFSTAHKPCIDIHAPVHQPQPLPVHKSNPIPVHKPLPPHAFSGNVKFGARADEHIPINPHKDNLFPVHEIKSNKIEDPHFTNVKFPSLKGNDNFKSPTFATHFDFDPHVGTEEGPYTGTR